MEPWQRDQYAVVLTVGLAHMGFDLTQPFMPLYVRELGMTDIAEAAFWSGLVVGVGPLFSGIMGPVWGAVADRYGRKAMVMRALLMIGMMQFAAAFVPDVYWLLAVRVVMGLFAGFTPMVMALAISLGPRERMSHAIGMVQAATFLPLAIGPNIGGLISDTFGLRTNFMLTGVILLVPAVVLHFMVKETGYDSPADKHAADEGGERPSVLGVLMLPGFVAALVILFVARFTDRTLPPILPLYLIELDTPSGQLATITGIVVASGAVAAACSSMFYGRWAQPENTRKLLLMALAGGAIFSGLIALAANWPQVLILRLCLGLLAGGTMSLAYTMGARLVPSSRSGLALSVLSSCGQLGGASAPMMAGLIGQLSLRSVFLTTGAAYLVALATAALPMLGRATAHEAEPEVDAAG